MINYVYNSRQPHILTRKVMLTILIRNVKQHISSLVSVFEHSVMGRWQKFCLEMPYKQRTHSILII
jgi:hypothetical protein